MTVNVGNGERSQSPLGQDAGVRRALSLAMDRAVTNDVVFEGAAQPGNQPVAPDSPWYDARFPVPARDVEAAKALLVDAGHERVAVEMEFANGSVTLQLMQVIQAMAVEAGFDVTLSVRELAAVLEDQTAGAFQANQVGWSGRPDPDGNIHPFVTCGRDQRREVLQSGGRSVAWRGARSDRSRRPQGALRRRSNPRGGMPILISTSRAGFGRSARRCRASRRTRTA